MVTVHVAAEILDVSADTIRRWEKKGLIKAHRSINNHRLFDIEEIKRLRAKEIVGASAPEFKILKDPTTEYKVIELFSGTGGMALGFENAGLNTELLVEIDRNCVETLKSNKPEWNVEGSDIRKLKFSKYRGKVDIVAGGFPCQAFSYAGLGKGFGDARGTLFFEFARCVDEVRPKIALGENVRGLIAHDQGRTLVTMIKILDELGYNVKCHLLRAQFLDVPQKRERLMIIGTRKDLQLTTLIPKEKDYLVTIREALRNCPDSVGAVFPPKKRQIMELIPPGGYWRDLPEDIQREYMGASYYHTGGRTGMARRMSWDEPSLTLTCSPAQKQTERCHPEETRPFTVREYARIQSFPDEWQFKGSVASQYKQIGNAVPVNLAYHIGRCLIAMLDRRIPDECNVLEKSCIHMQTINNHQPCLEI